MTEIKTKLDALQSLPKDERDFSHSQVFGSLTDLPTDDFMIQPLEIKNQDINYASDFCASYAAAEVAEDEDHVAFVPEWTFAQAKGLLAKTKGESVYDDYGLNLRDISAAAVKYGFLPRVYDPFRCNTIDRPARETLVRPENWESFINIKYGDPYRKASYFAIDGPHDTFDNFRSALWLNKEKKQSIFTGVIWRSSWTGIPTGIIPLDYESNGGGHAFKFCGQKTIDGVLYLVAQLSDGPELGDKGFYYFPREVVNKECGPFGAYAFTDLPVETAVVYQASGITVHDSWLLKVLKLLINFLKKL